MRVSTASSQNTNKYCLTENEQRFVLMQAFQLQECDSLRKSEKILNTSLKNIIVDDNMLLENQKEQLSLLAEHNQFSERQILTLTSQLKTANKKAVRNKFLCYIIAGVGSATTIYFMVK